MASTTKHKEYQNRRNRTLRERAIQLLGGACAHCGLTDRRCLQIDHVNGGGTRELREVGNQGICARIAKTQQTEGYQLLCANCNWIKRYERGETRSQRRPLQLLLDFSSPVGI